TRLRTASATLSWPLSARDTVATDTFASLATSLIVGLAAPIPFSIHGQAHQASPCPAGRQRKRIHEPRTNTGVRSENPFALLVCPNAVERRFVAPQHHVARIIIYSFGALARIANAWISSCIIAPNAAYTARCLASGAMPANAALRISRVKWPWPS